MAPPPILFSAALIAAALVTGTGSMASPQTLSPDYNQWKEALGATAVVQTNLTAPAGFVVELIRAARAGEGSWVSFVFDSDGRILIGREDRGLVRLTLPSKEGMPEKLESLAPELLECRGLLFARGALYANANNSKGLYRLRDAAGDGLFSDITLLKQTPGGVGHGRNDLALGPDGALYSIHGDDVGLPGDVAAASPFRALSPGGLLPCAWENHLYGGGAKAPCGQLVRSSPDGTTWEVIAGGLRNPYGIAFNEDGEAFTYDADLEWDIGLPWYHATRVLHLVPGADYGWRRSAGNLPVWLPDSRPAVVDIGKGSPTAIAFGTASAFPPALRRALFILDWAYGRILAVHLTPRGASYTGRVEEFLRGRPLNVTDLAFGPDGALWFTTGGRKTQSALYRVRYTGSVEAEAPPDAEVVARNKACASVRALRRKLEGLAAHEDKATLKMAWTHLVHDDDWVRHAARLALERQPVASWQDRALAEMNPMAATTAMLALARTGPPDVRARLLERLASMPQAGMTVEQKLAAVRACEVVFIRWGQPAPDQVAMTSAWLEAAFPDKDARVNQQMCALLVYLNSPNVVTKTLPLLASAKIQEETLHYLHVLRLAENGWNLDQRRTYFQALRRAREFTGAHYLPLVLKYIHADARATLGDAERAALGDSLAPPEPALAPVLPPDPNRRFVKAWQLSDLEPALAEVTPRRDLQRGKAVYAAALCLQCHQFSGTGTPNGPDLTGVAGRFPRRDLLEHILEPSKLITENYRNVSVTTKSGVIMDGRFLAEDEQSLTLANNPIEPDHRWTVRKSDIAAKQVSDVSPMPPALLNSFTKEEVLDLMAWLEFGGGEARAAGQGK